MTTPADRAKALGLDETAKALGGIAGWLLGIDECLTALERKTAEMRVAKHLIDVAEFNDIADARLAESWLARYDSEVRP